ncbi:MAG TPA: glycosyltransferase family 1 protein [Fimbriimonas sp.]|nr:glycosyltransferase family 1 protein [Fimbriimonas sp.]
MKILISAISRFQKPSGICRHAANIAAGLKQANADNEVVLLVADYQEGYFRSSFDIERTGVILKPVHLGMNAFERNVFFLKGLSKLANEQGFDILHLSFPVPMLKSGFKGKVVASIHDMYPFDIPENFGWPRVLFNRMFLVQCVSKSDWLTCVSSNTHERLVSYFPVAEQKASVIYNSIDFNSVTPQKPKEDRIAAESFVLAVAQHRKNKNIDLLLKAIDELTKVDPQRFKQLVIVGSQGPETASLMKAVSAMSLEDKAIFLPAISDAELAWLYSNARVFVNASSFEGFCIPVVEALHFGAAAVCSDIKIHREIGQDRCRYFKLEEGAAGLVQAIQATDISECRQTGVIDERFSRLKIGRQYQDVYEKLLGEC